ncbi:protein of unknown function [Virgibacillus subterraneus]|uniref:DUF4269 domain-containing protein n=1 Tax=Virgibacillus subterraneus TaxID=621109 RepID=A0A1H9JNV2_9BACI|nr:protein of unknown function [Virgibacillus subterraneus]
MLIGYNLFKRMETGNEIQQTAYKAVNELGTFNELSMYNPVLCGTLPIGIDVEGSDLDVIMEVQELNDFKDRLQSLYSSKESFKINTTTIRNKEVIKANFIFNNFEFELFGQDQPVHKQHAYLHMVIELELLQQDSKLRKNVVKLKQQGYKTEPAFCTILGITGDPYAGLIQFGVEKGIITDVL